MARNEPASRRKLSTTRKEAVDESIPRYMQVARQLTDSIADGRYPIGSQLPTELELCEQLGISRFTAREAIRVLVNHGLVVRRQRVGTTVVALPDENRYTLALSSLRDLLQYAQHTELCLSNIGRVTLTRKLARDLGLSSNGEWLYASGVRTDTEDSQPLCVTRLYINPSLRGIEAKLRKRHSAVYTLLEKEYGVLIDRVEQELQGVILSDEDAALLGTAPGEPGLRIVRRYYDSTGRLLEVADSIHPSDRFSYRMQLTR